MSGLAVVAVLSVGLFAQAQETRPRGDRTTVEQPKGSAEEGTKRDAHGAASTGGSERGTSGPSTSGGDPAGARATEKAGTPQQSALTKAASRPTRLRRSQRGSGDMPTLNSQYGQASPTYEDSLGKAQHPRELDTTKQLPTGDKTQDAEPQRP